MTTNVEYDKFKRHYRIEYESFGEDRKQEDVPDLPQNPKKLRRGQKIAEWTEFDKYWANRLDQRNGAWTAMPGYSKTDPKTRLKRFYATVSNILMNLAPSEIFNPSILWLREKERMRRALSADDQESKVENPEAQEALAEERKREFLEDVERVRHADKSGPLINLLQGMRSVKSRFVLLVEILSIEKEQNKVAKALDPIEELLKQHAAELEGLRTQDAARKASDRSKPKTLRCDDGWSRLLKFLDEKRAVCASVRQNIERKANQSFVDDIDLIRKSKDSLFQCLKKMNSLKTRLILMTELLYQAFEPRNKKGEKDLLTPVVWANVYDILWSIEEMIEKNPELKGAENMPPPPQLEKTQLSMDMTLVYDDYKKVEKLIAKVQKKRAEEKDPIKLQLVDMFDKLPPLSKFTYGMKLDTWQKRVLTWIDAGRSTIICAPTSSGKTVLSSYAALGNKGSAGQMQQAAAAAETKGEVDEKKEKVTPEPINGEEVEGELSDEEDDEDDDEDSDSDGSIQDLEDINTSISVKAARADRRRRMKLLAEASNFKMNRVLFVVPTEPLVWQVGAYFSQLLHREGDRHTNVAIVTDQLVYHPLTAYGVMPQIVVGTPMALETELTKCRGRVGSEDYYRKVRRDSIPGGFDHFDWVVYDEVHALDGEEGQALQRLIRSMNCKLLALSATVGNAEQLRGWLEAVKGEQLDCDTINVTEDEVGPRIKNAVKPFSFEAQTEKASVTPANAFEAPIRIQVEKTQECDQLVIEYLTLSHTVKDLKDSISANWANKTEFMQDAEMSFDQLQLFLGDPMASESGVTTASGAVDLVEDKMTLGSYGFKAGAEANLVKVYKHVNLVTHQGRFINLQRYVWSQPTDTNMKGSLSTISPLSAVDSVTSLADGILEASSLSFTSRDLYQTWTKLSDIYPPEAVQDVNPDRVFTKGDRITLQATKLYEDKMKQKLRFLAVEYPIETQELLHFFSLKDPENTHLDLTELVIELRRRDMTPCLPFHLNSFEAIKLFKSLLHGLELRQHKAHPTFYTTQKELEKASEKATKSQVKSFGGNEKERIEAEKTGDLQSSSVKKVDLFEPHADFTAGARVPSIIELEAVAKEMESYDGFKDKKAAAGSKLDSVRAHALMRGLRRGIGLFIKEVSFPAYRRAVMRLASKGELAVVISDDSLAFGVNMPFRTCIFCGEMYDKEANESRLTPLMAQQMSGRAGRRGLDQQGNLIYVGSRAKFIRKLMIGKVSNIVGRDALGRVIEPRYPALFAQNVLASRYVGVGRAALVGGETLNDYIERFRKNAKILDRSLHAKGPKLQDSYLFNTSKELILSNRLVVEDDERPEHYKAPEWPEGSMHHLSLLWMLRDFGHQGISLTMLLTEIYEYLAPQAHLVTEKKTEQDKARMVGHRDRFMAMLLIILDRHAYVKPTEGDTEEHLPALQNLSYFNLPANKEHLELWESHFAELQRNLNPAVKDPVPPGTLLDGTLFACLLDRNLCHSLTDNKKQNLKQRLWNVGQIVRFLHNCSWPSAELYRVITLIVADCFQSIRYLNRELIREMVDFENCTDIELERKEVKPAPSKKQAAGNATATFVEYEDPRDIWRDATPPEDASDPILAGTYTQALVRMSKRADGVEAAELLRRAPLAFKALRNARPGDATMIKFLADYPSVPPASGFKAFVEKLGRACRACSFGGAASGDEQHTLGMITWYAVYQMSALKPKIAVVLQLLYDNEPCLLSEDAIKLWYSMDADKAVSFLPPGCGTSEEQVSAIKDLKASKGLGELIEWFDEAEEDSDEDDDDSD